MTLRDPYIIENFSVENVESICSVQCVVSTLSELGLFFLREHTLVLATLVENRSRRARSRYPDKIFIGQPADLFHLEYAVFDRLAQFLGNLEYCFEHSDIVCIVLS